ncbi:MAG: type II secretion system F family protein [Actinomycetia bacterium]|nr:type II secretion system F family protein [Actinomycetes bacterium]
MASSDSKSKPEFKQLSAGELARLFYNLGMIYSTGISLTSGFEILSSSADRESDARLMTRLGEAVGGGERLSEAFISLGCLPPYALGLLQVAEQTGLVADTLQSLADFYNKRDRLNTTIRSALIYPLVMLVILFVVVVLILTQVMPVFDQVFAQLGYSLTGLASGLLAAGAWIRGASLWLGLVFVILIAVFLGLRLLPSGRRFYSWLFEHNPLTGRLSFQLSSQRVLMALATMLRSGVAPLSAVQAAQPLADDSRVRQAVSQLAVNLADGQSFQKAVLASGILPRDSRTLVTVSFSTGLNAEAFQQVGEDISYATEWRILSLVSAIEPTLVALMSILVGTILLSVLLPMLAFLTSI